MTDTPKHHDVEEATLLVEAGRRAEWTSGIVNVPVYRASTCVFNSYEELQERTAAPSARHLFYARKGTPTQWALEDAITDISDGEGTMLYPSGVAALAGAMLACVDAGDHILIPDSVFDPTRSIADNFLTRFDISASYYDPRIGANIDALMQPNTKLVMTESPGSVTFEIQDIPAIAAVAHKHGAKVITDNTWATPIYFKPLDHGADISVEAVTKYIGGHSDIMMGAAVANKATFKRLQRAAFAMGQLVSPDDASLALRGIRTLAMRLKHHQENALELARWLEGHDLVHAVLQPALESHPDHALFKRDFKGSSGLFSIVMKGGRYEDTAAMIDDMRLFKIGYSWGGYESLILPSDPAPYRTVTPWTSTGPVLRIHAGLEDIKDLILDMDAGLERYRKQIA